MEHKGTITLETDRLILRRFRVEDSEVVFRNWTNDPEVAKFVRWNAHESVQDTIDWLTIEENSYDQKNYYTWAIVLKETNEPIGSMSALFREDEDERYEIGYGIGRKYWNQGITTEALKCVMKFLTEDVGIKKFICRHAKLNPASGAVMQKVGFKYTKDGLYQSYDGSKSYESKIYYLDIN